MWFDVDEQMIRAQSTYLLVFVNSFASHLLIELHQDQEFAANSIIIQEPTSEMVLLLPPSSPSNWQDAISLYHYFKQWQCNSIARQYSITQIFRTVSVKLLPSLTQMSQGIPLNQLNLSSQDRFSYWFWPFPSKVYYVQSSSQDRHYDNQFQNWIAETF